MSVNIYDGTNLTPIAGKTVPMPTPDYVDEQFNPSTTYSKGMTCIEGNVRYRYKNSTATSGHRPPDTTYWEVLSVASELLDKQDILYPQSGVWTSLTPDTSKTNKTNSYNIFIPVDKYKQLHVWGNTGNSANFFAAVGYYKDGRADVDFKNNLFCNTSGSFNNTYDLSVYNDTSGTSHYTYIVVRLQAWSAQFTVNYEFIK